MTERSDKLPETAKRDDKPVIKRGFPPTPPRPAMDDLRFMVKESLQLGKKIISEIDRAIKIMKE